MPEEESKSVERKSSLNDSLNTTVRKLTSIKMDESYNQDSNFLETDISFFNEIVEAKTQRLTIKGEKHDLILR